MGSNPFKDDESNRLEQGDVKIEHIAVMSVFSFLAISAVFLRLWARKIKRSVWELNDYLIIVGLVEIPSTWNCELATKCKSGLDFGSVWLLDAS